MPYYKLANPQGWDFYTGKTINYREAVGGIVKAPDYKHIAECGEGLHYCANPNDCFVGARIPCSAYEVKPVGRRHRRIDDKKDKAETLRVIREIIDLDTLFGWRYSEVLNPVIPFYIAPPSDVVLYLPTLYAWISVGGSVRASVWDSVWGSVRDSVWDSVWGSVRDRVWASMQDRVWGSVRVSVWASMRASMQDSMRASVWVSMLAYIGSLFPGILHWEGIDHLPGVYPFQSAVDLWRVGLVPSFDGRLWRLHGGPSGEILWQGSLGK